MVERRARFGGAERRVGDDIGRAVRQALRDHHPGAITRERRRNRWIDFENQSASCWYAIDWNDSRCSGETPSFSMAARCSGVE
jgi:hypothetical protein